MSGGLALGAGIPIDAVATVARALGFGFGFPSGADAGGGRGRGQQVRTGLGGRPKADLLQPLHGEPQFRVFTFQGGVARHDRQQQGAVGRRERGGQGRQAGGQFRRGQLPGGRGGGVTHGRPASVGESPRPADRPTVP